MNGKSLDDIFTFGPAGPEDSGEITAVLEEAAEWLRERSEELWRPQDLDGDEIARDVVDGLYRKAAAGTEIAGCFRFQTEDKEYWEDVPHSDSAFIHRLAVRRKYAGSGLAARLMGIAKDEARSMGKRYLRLDCANRPRLRAVYEKQGFRFHSLKRREPYEVARYEFEL